MGFARVNIGPELNEEDEERKQEERTHMKKSLRQRLKRNREIRQDLSMFESAENLTKKLERMKRNVDKYLRAEIPDEMKKKNKPAKEEIKARPVLGEERMDKGDGGRGERGERMRRAEEMMRRKKREARERKEREEREARERKEREEREAREAREREIKQQEEMERRHRQDREYRESMEREQRERREHLEREAKQRREREDFERQKQLAIETEINRVRSERERVELLKKEIEEERERFKKEMEKEKQERDKIERIELERLRKLKEKLEKNDKERERKMKELQRQMKEESQQRREEHDLREQMLRLEEQEVIESEKISIGEDTEEVQVETAKASRGKVKGQIAGHAEADELTRVEYENRRIFKRVNKELRMQQRKKYQKIKLDRSRAKKLNFAAARPMFGDEPRNLRPLAMFDIDKEMQKVEDNKVKMREQEKLMSRKFGEFFVNRKEQSRGLVALDRLGAPLDKIPEKHCNHDHKFVNKKLEMKAKSLNAWGRPPSNVRKSNKKSERIERIVPIEMIDRSDRSEITELNERTERTELTERTQRTEISENVVEIVQIHNKAGGESHPDESDQHFYQIELEKEAGIAAPMNINDLPGLNDEPVNKVERIIDVSSKPNEHPKNKRSAKRQERIRAKPKIYQPNRSKRSRSKKPQHKATADLLLPGNRIQAHLEKKNSLKRVSNRLTSRSRSRNKDIGPIKSLKKPKVGGIYGIGKAQLKSNKKRERERSMSQKSDRNGSRKGFDPNRLATNSQSNPSHI